MNWQLLHARELCHISAGGNTAYCYYQVRCVCILSVVIITLCKIALSVSVITLFSVVYFYVATITYYIIFCNHHIMYDGILYVATFTLYTAV